MENKFTKIQTTIDAMLASGQQIPPALMDAYAKIIKQEMVSADDAPAKRDYYSMIIKNEDYSAITKNTLMDNNFYRFLFHAPLYRGKEHKYVPENKIDFVVTKIEMIAKEIGGTELLRQFKRLCKAKKEEVKETLIENQKKELKERERMMAIDGNLTKFQGLPDNSTGNKYVGWEWSTNLGFVAKEEGDKKTKIVTACKLPALINRQVINIDGNVSADMEQFELLYVDSQNQWRTRVAERGQLVNSRRVIELASYGLGIDSKMAPLFSSYMLSMLAEQSIRGGFPQAKSTKKLMVKIDGKFTASYQDKDLIFTESEKFPGLMKSLVPAGEKKDWYEGIKKLRKASHNQDFNYILATMFTPVIVSILQTQGFVCEIYGESQTGKSAMLKVCSTVWGGYADRESFVFSANSTDCFTENILSALNAMPFVVDDFNEIEDDKKRQIVQKIMMIANGRGRGRSNRNLEQNLSSFELTSIIGAEEPISTYLTNGGAHNRLISKRFSVHRGCVPWYKENGDSAVPDVLRFFSTHHGYAGIDFIHKVNEINKKEIEDIKDKYDSELRKRVRAAGKSDGQVQPLAIIMTASHLINELLFCDGVELSYDDALACMTNSDTVDPSMRFYHSIENRFALNYDKFAGTHDSSSYDAYPENFRGGFWGVYKEKVTTIETLDDENRTVKRPAVQRVLNIMPAILEKWAREEKVNIAMFYDCMRDRGILQSEKGRNTKKIPVKHLGTSGTRMVQLILPTMTTDDVGSAWDDDDDDDNQKQATSNQNDDDDSDDFPAEWTDKGKTVSFIKAADEIREIKSEYMQYNPDEDPLSDIQ